MARQASYSSFVFICFVFTTLAASAEEVPFKQIWEEIFKTSPGFKAAQYEYESAEEAKYRAARHWFPRIYVDVRSYQTNDPGQSFIGLLEQRSLQASDFNPDTINHPEAEIYSRGALGLDLPLYEGGMKASQFSLQTHLSTSQINEANNVRAEQYAEVAKSYGSIGHLDQQREKLVSIKQIIERVLKSYQIGVRSNPVGYSGLLGLRSLNNRIAGLIIQYQAQVNAYYFAIEEMGFKSKKWTPVFEDSISFANKYFKSSNDKSSFKVASLKERALVAQESAEMEKSRFRPRVGAFAETYVFSGERDTANGYTVGLYLQWSLFNPSDYGINKESKLKSMAAEKYSEAVEQKENAEKKSLDQSISALTQNISLLEEGHKILIEQTQVAENLFRNGSINALQFVEVLNRRVDLITLQADAGLKLLDSTANKILKTQFELPHELAQGKLE